MRTVVHEVGRLLIRGYQRWISPRKGWRCAHAARHGGRSCSAFAMDALQGAPLHGAARAIVERLRACAAAAPESAPKRRKRRRRRKAGDDTPDLPDVESLCSLPCEGVYCCASLPPW